jgi:hypothetical protein
MIFLGKDDDENTEHSDQQQNHFCEEGNANVHPNLACTEGQLFSLVIVFFLFHNLIEAALQNLRSVLNILTYILRSKLYFSDKILHRTLLFLMRI